MTHTRKKEEKAPYTHMCHMLKVVLIEHVIRYRETVASFTPHLPTPVPRLLSVKNTRWMAFVVYVFATSEFVGAGGIPPAHGGGGGQS